MSTLVNLTKYFYFLLFLHLTITTFGQRNILLTFSNSDSCRTEVHVFSNQKYQTTGQVKNKHYSFVAERGKPYELTVNPECGKAQFIFIKASNKSAGDTTIYIKIEDSYHYLDEFVVKGERNRFSYKGDTLVINTDSLSTVPQADGLEIFEEIKGLQVNSAGQLFIFGNQVTSAKINNRRILGGKPTENLTNLKADMIEKLEFIVNPQTHEGQLNIILKKNKSQGIYGLFNLGLNLDPDHIASLKLNRLGITTFQFFNLNSDNVNYRFKDEVPSEMGIGILHEAYQKGIYSHLNEVVFEGRPSINTNPEHGISERSKLKHAINFENDQIEFNSTLRIARLKNSNQFTSAERVNTDEFQTENTNQIISNLTSYQLSLDQDLKKKIGTKHQLYAKNLLELNQDFQNQDVTFKTTLNGLLVGNFNSNKNQLEKNQVRNQFDIALFLKPKVKGGKLFVHYQPIFTQSNGKGLSQSLDQSIRSFENTQVHLQHNVFLTTSYAIGKRWVNENRLILSNSTLTSQNSTLRGISSLKEKTNSLDFGNIVFYQHYRWNLSIHLGFKQFWANRSIQDVPSKQMINQLKGIRDIYWKKSFSNRQELIVSFQRKLELPTLSDYFMVDDSLNPLAIQLPNIAIEAFKTNQVRFTLSGSRATKNNHSFSGEFQMDEGQPIISSYYNQSQYVTQLINSELTASQARLGWTISRTFSKINADWVHTTHVGYFQSYNVFNGQYLNNQMQFLSFTTNFSEKLNKALKWKIQSENQFFFSTQPTRLLRQQIQLTYTFQKKVFVILTGINTNSKIGNNFTLNFETSTFLGKRKILNASIVIQNALNNQNIFQQFQLNNLIFSSTNQIVPFSALGKITLYLEKFR